ncbi:hypothetical protein WJX75_001938 [Coccomyxa subellipsoidea]|uniref:Uncharacterized protein n=1 Tax=Coccomyxa subellipsoidea TaxID=248742 RepID=A0ABR2YR21_9CHLO
MQWPPHWPPPIAARPTSSLLWTKRKRRSKARPGRGAEHWLRRWRPGTRRARGLAVVEAVAETAHAQAEREASATRKRAEELEDSPQAAQGSEVDNLKAQLAKLRAKCSILVVAIHSSYRRGMEDVRSILHLRREKELLLQRLPPAQVAVLRTPPQFWLADRWLQDNPCPDRMSYDQTLDFVDNVPVSIETRVALKSCLFEAKPGFFSPVESATAVFERPEVVHKLLTKGKEGKVQVTLVGRRRLGKTMSVPHAVVEARAQIYPELGRDKTYFFYDSNSNVVHVDNVITVLRLLFHMKVPAIFDEFQDLPYALAKQVKACIERGLVKEALGITMFGSAEGAVRICSAMWMSGLASKGASTPIRMPLPGVNVLLALLQHRCPELSASEQAAEFLRRLALCGRNLGEHDSAAKPSARELLSTSLASPNYCDFTDPRLYTYSELRGVDADEAEEIEAAICRAEGFIVECLVCLDYDLRHQFLDIMGIDSQVRAKLSIFHGMFAGIVEIDGMFSANNELFMVSAKRHQSEQHLINSRATANTPAVNGPYLPNDMQLKGGPRVAVNMCIDTQALNSQIGMEYTDRIGTD